MKKYMLYGTLCMLLITLAACRPTPSKQLKDRLEKCGMFPELGYNDYLDQLIVWQDSSKARKMKKLTFNVKIHFVDSNTNLMSKQESDSLINFLNSSFKYVNIGFKASKKVTFIKSEVNIDEIFKNTQKEDSLCAKHYSNKSINLYILNRNIDVLGYTHYPMMNNQRIFISRKKLFDPAIIHEFGHFFGLLHTFEHFGGEERITRTNCKKAGDKICDTPADPFGASFIENDCELYGKYQNAEGQEFKPDMSNYMSYYGKCRHSFSQEQIKRMYFVAKNVKTDLMKL